MIEQADPKDIAALRQHVKAITFDLWGTLLNDAPSAERLAAFDFRQMRRDYFNKKIAEAGFHFSDDEIQKAYTAGHALFDALWKKHIGFHAGKGIDEMLKVLQIEIPENVHADITNYFQEVVNENTIRLFEGVDEVLKSLHKKFKIGLISDTGWTPGRVLSHHLERHGVLHYFDSRIYSDEIGYTKPRPILFETAMKELGSTPKSTLHIGDLKFTDIRGANQIGCYSAWIHRPDYLHNHSSEDKPTITVTSVNDLLKVFEENELSNEK